MRIEGEYHYYLLSYILDHFLICSWSLIETFTFRCLFADNEAKIVIYAFIVSIMGGIIVKTIVCIRPPVTSS